MTTKDDPAFPSHGSMGEVVQTGLTKREYFAGLAPAVEVEAIRTEGIGWRGREHGRTNCSIWKARCIWADNMLAALEDSHGS
jgi:hypothetical protein